MSPPTEIEFSAELLRTLHRIHRQRTDLIGRLQRGPRQIAAGQAMVDQAQQELENARQGLRKAQLAAEEKQLQLQGREAQIEKLKAKLNTASSNREYSLLKEQIAADEQANSVQSDEILEALEHLDQLEADVQQLEAKLQQQQQEHAERVEEVEARLTQLRSDLERVDAELAQAEMQIPPAARPEYNRMIAAKGEEALAPIDEHSCGGCYQRLTTQVMNQLYLSHLIHCPNCNAFLYLPEDRRVR